MSFERRFRSSGRETLLFGQTGGRGTCRIPSPERHAPTLQRRISAAARSRPLRSAERPRSPSALPACCTAALPPPARPALSSLLDSDKTPTGDSASRALPSQPAALTWHRNSSMSYTDECTIDATTVQVLNCKSPWCAASFFDRLRKSQEQPIKRPARNRRRVLRRITR